MPIVVPFDGSALSRAALRRAKLFQSVLDERLVAVTVIEHDAQYARERGWLDDEEEFDSDRVVAAVHETVTEIAPEADFRHELLGRRASSGAVARHVRSMAREEDASIVFVGSENAGDLVSSVSSVGSSVAADDYYDVFIVRHTERDAGAQPAEEYR
ncbi:universal stress protein [Salarchaeum sp. JOR-1]|uniref:universal stress protein n=1 Tax=Salarchaeum sp. JOR-1 TaxID=2599399 RepID=UPI00119887D8|nr:universal stress protein [Salarchaeum sp. JOR-1]QDX39768.1 universal stress protein [Salarchaeum sp. JOR-1]